MTEIIHSVIGTAGHIDHGKSALVRALTGIDPDRLKEERERGLTIDLGFARMRLPDGRAVGFIDVPGHERFVRNMVAGSTGIALAMLVIAADDSVMPQTREHVEILQLLGVKHCVVALNKCDIVEADWCELVEQDVREFLETTAFAAAPIVKVSAVTGDGVEALRATLQESVLSIAEKPAAGVFAMPLQRVFSLRGQGTVLTGVPVSGVIRVGDAVEVRPGGQKGKIRSIEAYGRPLSEARAGHSTALCVSGLDYKQHARGEVVTLPGHLPGGCFFEAHLRMLPSAPFSLEHLDEIFFQSGTNEVLAKVALLEAEPIAAGSEGFVQVRLPDPLPISMGDRFILRRPSPPRTVGGGTILAATQWRLKAGREKILARLRRALENVGSTPGKIEELALLREAKPFKLADLRSHLLLTEREAEDEVESLLRSGCLRRLRAEKLVHREHVDQAAASIVERLRESHESDPHLRWARQLDVCRDLLPEIAEAAVEDLERKGALVRDKQGLALASHVPRLTPDQEALADAVVQRLGTGYETPSVDELAKLDRRTALDPVLEYLSGLGKLVRLPGNLLLSGEAVDKARSLAISVIKRDGVLISGDFKNLLETSRKYALPLLEHFDGEGLTLRDGSKRTLRKRG